MRLRTMAYGLLIALLLVGCGDRISMRQLEQLESRVNDVPDSVLTVLTATDMPRWGERRALYALLRTQADYKCFVPLTSDSLIRYATDYYDGNRKSYRAAMSWYSLGCVYSEMKDDAAAIDAYLRAQSLFPDTTVRYYGLCYQNLGHHYLKKNMIDEALTAYTLYYKLAEGHDRLYAAIGLAQAYIRNKCPNEAKDILEDLLDNHDKTDAKSLKIILFELGKIEYTFNKDNTKAEEYFDQLITLYDESEVATAYWFKGDIAEARGNTELAIHCYEQAMTDKSNTYLRYNCARSLQYLSIDSIKQPELYSYIKLFEQMSDSINRIERRSEIDEIHTAHAMELHQRELSEKHKRFMYIATLVLICLLASIAIAALYIEQRRKRHYLHLQQELQRNQAKVYKMYESIEAKRDNGALMREQVLSLYRANLETSIGLFHRESWHRRLQQLSELRSKDVPPFTIKEREQLAEVLERCFINVITNLRDETATCKSKLAPEDIQFCLLSAIGCSTGVIRECLAASADNVVNQRKKRLSDKLPSDVLSIFINKY